MKAILFPSTLAIVALCAATQRAPEPLMNQIQVIGTHNSYKQAIDPKLFAVLQKADSATMSRIDYEHATLTEQLNKGLLALEIDVYADTQGGKYAHPKGLDMVPGQPPYDAAGLMKEPGFKVFHIQDLDFRSNAPTFKLALQELKKWSAAHPTHHPVFIDALDKEILDNLGADKIITPDQVRGQYATLESAVLHRNWPTLRAAQGKFVFVLDELGEKRATYIQGHPSLKGRVLFADAEPGTPEAAIHIMNNAKKDQAAIKNLVEKGYIIRSRADSDTQEARRNDKSSFVAAEQSGAQIISTDYYQPSTHFKSPYSISFAGGTYFRPNPVNATQAVSAAIK
jgi:hypothetical protein